MSQYTASLHLDGLTASTITSHISVLKFHCKRKKNLHGDLKSVHVEAMLKRACNRECSQSSKCKEKCKVAQLERIINLAHTYFTLNMRQQCRPVCFAPRLFGFLRVSEYSFMPAGHTINFHRIEVTKHSLNIVIPSSKFS